MRCVHSLTGSYARLQSLYTCCALYSSVVSSRWLGKFVKVKRTLSRRTRKQSCEANKCVLDLADRTVHALKCSTRVPETWVLLVSQILQTLEDHGSDRSLMVLLFLA